MSFWLKLLSLLIGVYPVLAADDSAVVNERIPVATGEMERHWQVDCHSLWRQLAPDAADPEFCGLTAAQRRGLELCRYIHQPPGEPSRDACPDYREGLRLLTSESAEARCQVLAELVTRQAACAAPRGAP